MARKSLVDDLLTYLTELVNHGEPFELEEASKRLGRRASSIQQTLSEIRRSAVVVEWRRLHTGSRRRQYRVTILASGKSTPWPADDDPFDVTVDYEEAIRQARWKVQDDRLAHRRYWLERERAPRTRPAPPTFIDKETARALNGGYA